MFIVFEGLDGSGKSTQAKMLAKKMEELKLPIVYTFQPSRGIVGQIAHDALDGVIKLHNEALSMVFAADRIGHYNDVIKPNLNDGKNIICDRYFYSNMVYQGKTPELMKRIFDYNQHVANPPAKRPDIVLFIDVPPEECMERIKSSREIISIYEATTKLEEQRKRYMTVFEMVKTTEKIILIKASGKNPDEVAFMIWEEVKKEVKNLIA